MSETSIRAATPDDCRIILGFIKDLAEYEKALPEVKASEDDLHRALFADHPKAFALICSIDDAPVGFALYFFNYSTWTGKFSLFLEDLYVSIHHRGCGAGKALLKHLAQLAVEKRLHAIRVERNRLERARHSILRVIWRKATT